MEISTMLNYGCHMRVESTTRLLLITLITVATLGLFIQTIYLHGEFHSMKGMLPAEYSLAGRRIMYGRLFYDGKLSEVEITKPKTPSKEYLPYQAFGRETTIVRFNETINNMSYIVFNEFKPKTSGQKYYLYRHPTKISSNYNGNISKHVNNPGAFSVASDKRIYIMSAFARKLVQYPKERTHFKQGDPSKEDRLIVLVGWLNYDLFNSSLQCCLLLGNDSIVCTENAKRVIWTQVNKQPLMAVKFFCPVPAAFLGIHVKGATMSLPGERCLSKKFVAVEYLKRQPQDSIAVCAKIVYGTMSSQRLIEWFEIQKFIGVDKVLMYYYNLNTETTKVLQRYHQEGFLDLRPFDFPDADSNYRYVGQKEAQPFIDEQVVLYEAMERLQGYTYTAVIDVDEIIFARTSHKHNLKRFLVQLFRRCPDAAGFSFRTELFITDWENKEDMGPEMNMFWHTRYQNRTRPLEDRTKNILVMNRVILGSVWTHNYTALPQYKKFQVPASMGTLKHYRPCRKNWHCFLRRGYRDQTVAALMGNIKQIISNRFNNLLDKNTLDAIKSRVKNTTYIHGASVHLTKSITNKTSSLSRKKP
ncbi:uncharacterized protein LOC123554072 [Mercenaria mercenaria]|uniref:uncharacterized protein LOC123554072 n=1 Tax=Mercenaria mercenaria TaxID=6596 RepID=UPI00234EE001|nr:uncharacterized protein LOC123554072 [Mercenaria mercenaria]